jgi:hypothetical protein
VSSLLLWQWLPHALHAVGVVVVVLLLLPAA